MKKIFKSLTIAIIAITAALAGIFVVGCNDGDKDGKSDYNFTIVYADGKAVNGQTDGANGGKVYFQICDSTEVNCIPLSLQNVYADENGKLSLSQEQINHFFKDIGGVTVDGDITEFDFDVMDFPGYPAKMVYKVNGKGNYKIVLKAE